jgi:transposase-like protein
MVLSHLDEYGSVYEAAVAIGPEVGVQAESLRRWVVLEQARDTPEGRSAAEEKAESKRVKELERQVRELEEANEILKAASIFSPGNSAPADNQGDHFHRPDAGRGLPGRASVPCASGLRDTDRG